MARILSVPDFDFLSGFYYAEILELLIRELRENVPEITNESRGEPAIQLLSCFALAGHLANTLIDVTAFEALMVTCQLRDSLVGHFKLIDYEVGNDIPSSVDILLTLSKTFTASELLVPALSLFQTKRRSDEEPIAYEVQDAFTVTRTDQITQVWVFNAAGPTFLDRTTQANTDAVTWNALHGPTPAAGDALYLGHDTAMTDRLRISGLVTPMANVNGLWEYSDATTDDDFPDTVSNLGASLKLVVDSLLDTAPGGINHAGLEVVATLNATGATETVLVQWDGSSNFVEIGFLGQVTPSTDVRDYSVGTQWHRLTVDDETNEGDGSFGSNGNIDWVVPQSPSKNWQPIEVNGVTAFWVRFRVVSVDPSPVAPLLDRIFWNRRNNYVLVIADQGITTNEVLGSSDGTATQTFVLGQSNVIDGTVNVSVDATTWTEVVDFESSTSVDEHYRVDIDSDGIGTVTFGDGTNGKIPPSGTNNVTATYRYGANLDGNVGSDTITVNRSGVGSISRVTNPRPASGWVERRGATAEDRERLKVEGPASLRVLNRAVTGPDVEYLTAHFVNSANRTPFVRAKAIEEGYGAKTVKVVTVGPAGAPTTPQDRAELEVYFNGDPDTGESGHMVSNQRVFARDYVVNTINVVVEVSGSGIVVEEVKNAIRGLLSPVALADDGINFRWRFGQTVTISSIIVACLSAGGVEDVTVITPASNVVLTNEQLPAYGTVTATVVT